MSHPQYSQYRPSALRGIGGLPAHWQEVPLKFEASWNDEVLPEDTAPDREIFYVDISGVEADHGITSVDPMRFADAPSRARRLVRSGDVIISTVRTYLRAIARIVDVPDDLVVSTGFAVIRSRGRLHPEYLGYLLSASYFMDEVVARSVGVSYPAINASDLVSIKVPVPPSSEQTAIVEFLNGETAKIDALVAEQRRLVELLQEKRQAVISHAVTEGTDPHAVLEPSGLAWLGEIPSHWSVKRIKWVAQLESGHTPDKKVAAYWEGGDIPWVSLNDTGFLKDNDYIYDTAFNVTQLGIENSSARLLPAGAVVFSRDATLGRCAITARLMAVSQHFIAWIPGPEVLAEYLLLRLRSMGQELESMSTGATLRTIGMPEIRTLVTPVPPIEEQRAIVQHVAEQTGQVDELIAASERAVALLLERRAALISAAVTGQIDVRQLAAAEAA